MVLQLYLSSLKSFSTVLCHNFWRSLLRLPSGVHSIALPATLSLSFRKTFPIHQCELVRVFSVLSPWSLRWSQSGEGSLESHFFRSWHFLTDKVNLRSLTMVDAGRSKRRTPEMVGQTRDQTSVDIQLTIKRREKAILCPTCYAQLNRQQWISWIATPAELNVWVTTEARYAWTEQICWSASLPATIITQENHATLKLLK